MIQAESKELSVDKFRSIHTLEQQGMSSGKYTFIYLWVTSRELFGEMTYFFSLKWTWSHLLRSLKVRRLEIVLEKNQ